MEVDPHFWRRKTSTITTITTTKLRASAWNVMATATDRSSTNGSPNFSAPRARRSSDEGRLRGRGKSERVSFPGSPHDSERRRRGALERTDAQEQPWSSSAETWIANHCRTALTAAGPDRRKWDSRNAGDRKRATTSFSLAWSGNMLIVTPSTGIVLMVNQDGKTIAASLLMASEMAPPWHDWTCSRRADLMDESIHTRLAAPKSRRIERLSSGWAGSSACGGVPMAAGSLRSGKNLFILKPDGEIAGTFSNHRTSAPTSRGIQRVPSRSRACAAAASGCGGIGEKPNPRPLRLGRSESSRLVESGWALARHGRPDPQCAVSTTSLATIRCISKATKRR